MAAGSGCGTHTGGTGTGDAVIRTTTSTSKETEEIKDLISSPSQQSVCCLSKLSISENSLKFFGNPNYPELDHLFILHETIGHGGFSKVKVATDLFTGNKVAIKIVDKQHVGAELPRIHLEVETLQPLNHPHICKLFSVISTHTKIFMIMEYCPTDLYEHIVCQNDRLPVDEARRIFIQLLSAVAYLHSNGIVHRDLKPENVLLDRNLDVKLTDFGLCAVPGKNGINKPTLKTLCGSPAYCAPELLRGPPYIGSKVDVWSLGIMLFVLLVKELPFYSKNVKELYKKIQIGHYKTPEWISPHAKDLIDLMLESNVNLRPSLYRLWCHPWIQEGQLQHFQEQISQSHLKIENEHHRSPSHNRFFYPFQTIRFAFSSTLDNHDINVPVQHNNVVSYIETGGDNPTYTIKHAKSKTPILQKHETCIPKAPSSLQLPPKQGKSCWIHHAYKKTINVLHKCIPFRCGHRQDCGAFQSPDLPTLLSSTQNKTNDDTRTRDEKPAKKAVKHGQTQFAT